MISINLYCFASAAYASVEKENASIGSRGLFGGFWERLDDEIVIMSVIITSHAKVCNAFMGYYG